MRLRDPRRLNFVTLEKIGNEMRPGVAQKALVSFESATVRGYFIRHRHFKFEVAQLPLLAEDLQCATYKITDVSE